MEISPKIMSYYPQNPQMIPILQNIKAPRYSNHAVCRFQQQFPINWRDFRLQHFDFITSNAPIYGIFNPTIVLWRPPPSLNPPSWFAQGAGQTFLFFRSLTVLFGRPCFLEEVLICTGKVDTGDAMKSEGLRLLICRGGETTRFPSILRF